VSLKTHEGRSIEVFHPDVQSSANRTPQFVPALVESIGVEVYKTVSSVTLYTALPNWPQTWTIVADIWPALRSGS
jgi:hypothetical protein